MNLNKIKLNKVFWGVFVIIILILFTLGIMKFTDNNNLDEDEVTDYQYKLIYDFGGFEYDIYLLENDNIKVIEGSPIYDVCEGTDCIMSSGTYEYKDVSLDFSDKAMKVVVNFIKDLFKKYDTKELRVDEVTLTLDENRYLNGIVFNDDDVIMFSDDIKFETIVKEFNDDYDNIVVSNTATLLKESDDNKVVNNIRDYLNNIVREDFDNLNNDINDNFSFYKDNYDIGTLGVNFTLKMEWLGAYRVSFNYVIDGSIGGVGWFGVKGYTFNVNNGKIVSEIPEGYVESFYEDAVNNFKQQEIYINEKEQLEDNWSDILKTEMFKVGNWYETNDEVVFLIEAWKLGFDEATSKVITIKVKNPYGEF